MSRAGRGLLLALGLWLLVGHVLVLPAIESGGLAWLVDLAGHPPEIVARFVSNLVARVALVLTFAALLVGLGPRRLGLSPFFARFVGAARPEVLGFLRFTTASILFVSVAWEDVAGSASLPASMRDAHGLFALVAAIPGFDAFSSDAGALAIFRALTLLVLGAAALGAFSRMSVPLGAALYFVVAGLMRQPTWPYHTGLVPLYAMTVLAFFPSGDGLSLDAWLARRRGGATEPNHDPHATRHALYGWGRFAWVATLALPYTEAGLSKLCNGGLFWWEPTNLRAVLYLDSLNPMEFDFDLGLEAAPLPDAFFALLGLSAVLGEVAMIFVLFSRRARLVAPAVMIAMHVGIVLLQNILFFDLILMLAATYAMPLFDRDGGPWDPRVRASAPTDEVTPPHPPPPRVIVAALGVALFFWTFAIELFPFTAMQMYSHKRDTGVVDYHRLVAVHADGARTEERPEALFPALRDGRYRRVLRTCADDSQHAACRDFLALLLAHRARDGVVAFEVEHRRWDFVAEPDARVGDVVAVVRFPDEPLAEQASTSPLDR
ncbi:MAG: HTTM domain-containing protein [Myxococcota bacterium]|nr:HTTM domain-containing protein [Myxococcota bacterium]